MKNILAIGAHPDDIELGCAGTLIKHARKGANVYLLIMSEGHQGGDPKIRKKEQEDAAMLMGVKGIFWGNRKDTEFRVDQNTITIIENVVKKVQPDEVYVNYFDDSHQDHRALAQCTISATRYVKRVLFYEDYTSMNFEPDIFVDIHDVLDEKISIIKAFQSQISRDHPAQLNMIDGIRAIANFRGFHAKVQYAEGFKALRYLKLDIN
ncbi:MAG: PIG-L family deacetylase [Candidatus Omnitrophica bacterium]|nr:PIG-L family deacetylase [Candidatus Omnitrophota bacterium]